MYYYINELGVIHSLSTGLWPCTCSYYYSIEVYEIGGVLTLDEETGEYTYTAPIEDEEEELSEDD